MHRNTTITGAAAVVAAVGLIGTGAALSNAATGTPTPSPSTSSAPAAPDRSGGHAHTPVTGTELAKVTAAVKAEDSAVTVTSVAKDPDGSYDVLGTKAGAAVRLEASADLKTIGAATPGGPGGRGGPGAPKGTPVTGAELTKVTAAVEAKDAAVTVTAVHESPDGSYHVHGTKAGAPVHLEVSADLETVTVREGRPAAPRDADSTASTTNTAV